MKKKMSVLILSIFVLLFLTGCEENKEQKLVCTTTENEEGMRIDQVISMTYKNDKLTHMTMEVNTQFTDNTIKENWEVFKETLDEENQEFQEEGIWFKVTKNDQDYEYKTTLDIDVEKANEKTLEEQGFDGLKEDTSTLESSKEEAEKDGAVCKIEEVNE